MKAVDALRLYVLHTVRRSERMKSLRITTFRNPFFQSRIDQVEREIKDIEQKKEDEENEIDGTGSGSNEEDDDDDKYENTYEEKVRKKLFWFSRVTVIW